MADELTEEEIAAEDKKMREEVRQEVFEGKGLEITLEPEEIPDDPKEDDPPEEDHQAGLPPALMEQLEGINNRLGTLSTIEDRLKQTESRIGSMQNKARDEKLAAEKAKAEEPTPEEIAEAQETDENWTKFEKEFPDMAKAIDGKRAKDKKEIAALRADLSAVAEKKPDPVVEPIKSEENIEIKIVSRFHPDWNEVRQTNDFKAWLSGQSDDMKKKYTSSAAEDAVHVLNEFKNRDTSGPTPEEIAAAKKKRLAESVNPTKNHKKVKPKAVGDMNDAELRKDVENEVFGAA